MRCLWTPDVDRGIPSLHVAVGDRQHVFVLSRAEKTSQTIICIMGKRCRGEGDKKQQISDDLRAKVEQLGQPGPIGNAPVSSGLASSQTLAKVPGDISKRRQVPWVMGNYRENHDDSCWCNRASRIKHKTIRVGFTAWLRRLRNQKQTQNQIVKVEHFKISILAI